MIDNHNISLRRFTPSYGYGELNAVADNSTREGREQNRRVEIKLLVSRGINQNVEVKSSNDRHANAEVNYLLQRVERFEGICILTTNFEGSIDPAFKRRLAFRMIFPLPDETERTELWRRMMPKTAHVADDVYARAMERLRVVTPIDPASPEVRSRRDILAKHHQRLKEEAPFAYKPITPVVQTVEDAGVARRVARLFPIVTVKG